MVKRPAGHAHLPENLWDRGVGIPLLGEHLPARVQQGTPGPARAFGVRSWRTTLAAPVGAYLRATWQGVSFSAQGGTDGEAGPPGEGSHSPCEMTRQGTPPRMA